MRNSIYLLATILTFGYSVSVHASRTYTQDEYIETWKNVAIENMNSHKIPASITLAQGILESSFGNSDLARYANNHFGIKCHGWTGNKFYKDDDAKDECFRSYTDASQSYEDHSLFLTSRSRYSGLFELTLTDYKGWAKGLKSAGYATNPKYADLLIDIVEKYELYKFDSPEALTVQKQEIAIVPTQQPKQAVQPPVKNETKVENTLANSTLEKERAEKTDKTDKPTTAQNPVSKPEVIQLKSTQHDVLKKNNVQYVVARKGDTYYRIAKEFNMGLWQLYRYNDFARNKDVLEEGDIVYLQPKRGKLMSKKNTVVADGAKSYREISQYEGVKLSRILKENNSIEADAIPKKGEVVALR